MNRSDSSAAQHEQVDDSATTMESRRGGGNRGNQGQGERGFEGKASNPLKGAKPVRGPDGSVVGWEIRDPRTGKSVPKTLEWGSQNGLNPADFPATPAKTAAPANPKGGSDTGAKIVAGTLALGAIACAIAEPCGAAAAAALGLGGTSLLMAN